MIERATDAVVVEERSMGGVDAEMFGHEAAEPLGHGIEGRARQQDVGDHDAQHFSVWDLAAAPQSIRRKMAIENRFEIEQFEKMGDHRHGADFEGFQLRRRVFGIEHDRPPSLRIRSFATANERPNEYQGGAHSSARKIISVALL